MPQLNKYGLAGCWLFVVLGSAGCGREPAPIDTTEVELPEFRIPSVPSRAPIDTARLGSNVFDSICHIGNPFAVVGWGEDAHTRFLYFVGPFTGSGDGLVHPYLYIAIPGPDRATANTTLYLDRLDEAELRKHARPGELRQYLLPHIVGFPADARQTRRLLGEPARTRELESGRTRLVFERELCLNDKRLVGAYIDVEGDRLVAAKGVDHPDRLRWVVSAGRPPQPDPSPTYYQDWKPRDGTAQEAALAFVHFLEARNLDGARAKLWEPDSPPHPLEDVAKPFDNGATIDTSTLTYQTTRYELDLAEVVIAFSLSDGETFRQVIELRDAGSDRWRVSDWRRDSDS